MSAKVRRQRLAMRNDEQKKMRRQRNERPNFGNILFYAAVEILVIWKVNAI